MWWILAQSVAPGSDRNPIRVIVWSLVLIGIVLAAFVAVSLIRRWAQRAETSEPVGFTLGDLRQLYKNGKISQEEFERAKAKILATIRHDSGVNAPNPDEGEQADDPDQRN